MIDFSFAAEDDLLVDTVASFAADHLRAHEREHEDAGTVPDSVVQAYAQIGLPELGLPGSGTDGVTTVRVLEELAAGDAGAALRLSAPTLSRLVARELGGDGGADFVHVVEKLNGITLSWPWLPVDNLSRLLVFDLDGAWQVVPVACEPVRGLGLRAAGGARCTEEGPTARREAGKEAVGRALGHVRLHAAALLVGLARASLHYVKTYVRERSTFGKPLAQHQGVAFLVAEMTMRTEAARLMVQAAAHRRSGITDAYVEAVEAGLWVTDYGVQLLGGHGYMTEHPVEKWMRDARALALLWGGTDLTWT